MQTPLHRSLRLPLNADLAGCGPPPGWIHHHRPVAQPTQLPAALPEALWDAPPERLWAWARDPRISAAERARCLLELGEREAHQLEQDAGAELKLPSFLIQELDGQPEPAWRDALLAVSEWTQVPGSDDRRRLERAVLAQARVLRDAGAQAPLWSALRRYATLIEPAQVVELLAFLSDDRPLTHQATLQCIQTVFSLEPPPPAVDLRALIDRVHQLARTYLSAGADAATAAIAVNAYRAAALLGDPAIDELTEQLAPGLQRAARQGLRRVADAWRSSAGSASALAGLDRTLNRLASPPTMTGG